MATTTRLPDINPEAHYRLSELRSLIPGKPHVATIWRWILEGIGRNHSMKRKLRAMKVGGLRYVRGQDLIDFLAEDPAESQPLIRPMRTRQRESKKATATLKQRMAIK